MRFIGTKSKLLPEIDKIISKFSGLPNGSVFCDLFAGTGSVGDYFQNKFSIIANDNLYFSYLLNRGKLNPPKSSFPNLKLDPFNYFNSIDTDEHIHGFCYKTFAPTVSKRMYFSDLNSKKIDFIREKIDEWHSRGSINENEKDYLLACLLESVSKVSNVAGVYSAFLRHWDSRALKPLKFIKVENKNKPNHKNIVFNEDAKDLIRKIKGDILYLDPPYTATQYISQYHVLETIAKNDSPAIHGVGAHRNNGNQISSWSKQNEVASELDFVLSKAKFRYIVMSYSDGGLLSKKIIEKVFKRYAKEDQFLYSKINYVKYKSSRSVSKELKDGTQKKPHFEWLFLIEKKENPLINSPLNYIGGKFNLLEEILPKFPSKISTFYDLFGGGGSVTANIFSTKTIYNDLNFNVKNLIEFISLNNSSDIIIYILKTIKKYQLEKGSKTSFNLFRDYYNKTSLLKRKPIDLLILIIFGFEHQIRFNSKLEFNNPIGNSGFNEDLMEKLISFGNRMKSLNIKFEAKDYLSFEKDLETNDFVYCDPPYLLTRGAYNDGKRGFKGWDENSQKELLGFLSRISNRGIKFALSSMMKRDEEYNLELEKWAKSNEFNIIMLNKKIMRNRRDRTEVLITNYKKNNE
jgi:adenine-specific DNA-methyltransferase